MAREAIVRAYLGLGSNLGDRMASLSAAAGALRESDGIEHIRLSPVYETAPVGPIEQGDFLNAAAEIDTTLPPRQLLDRCKALEKNLGRQEAVRWGPRVIDIDILLYGDVSVDEEGLRIPHPELLNRAFAIVPLLDLAPDLVLPDGRSLAEARAALAPIAGVVVAGPLVGYEST